MRVLVAGPDNGMEFGWFLMRWQAKIRKMSREYDKTFVITSADRIGAYKDFARHYTFMPDELKPDMWRFSHCTVDYVIPNRQMCCSVEPQEFIKFGKGDFPKCIVLHPRKKKDGREWGINKWKEFLNLLSVYIGGTIPIVTIGSNGHVYVIPDNENLTNFIDAPFEKTTNILSNAHLCIGPSSGPMHLASLCSCPHLIWTDDKVWNLGIKKGTNRERYETVWNPFDTEAIVMDEYGWNPSVDHVFERTVHWLKQNVK